MLSGDVSDQAGPRNPRFILHATPLTQRWRSPCSASLLRFWLLRGRVPHSRQALSAVGAGGAGVV